jgi:hypothetical protein
MEEFQGGFLPRPEGAKLVQIDIDPFELAVIGARTWRSRPTRGERLRRWVR